jgi:hypothetical protein
MKHYVLPYFPHTLPEFIDKYVIKYGDNADNVRNGTGWNWNSPHDFVVTFPEARALVGTDAIAFNQSLNKRGEVNRHVILAKSGPDPLGKVEPWDMLIVVGHGVNVNNSPQAKKIGSDPQKGGNRVTGPEPSNGWTRHVNGKLYATANEVASWLDGKLKKNHLLVKLVMCNGGGPFGRRTADENFAKDLAQLLYARGYTNVAVGGYRGDVKTGISGLKTWDVTRGTREFQVTGGKLPLTNRVVNDDGVEKPGKENLDYYHGATPNLIGPMAIKMTKNVFRMFGGVGNTEERLKLLVQTVTSEKAKALCGDKASHEFLVKATRALLLAERANAVAKTQTSAPKPPTKKATVPTIGRSRSPQLVRN